MRVSRCLCGETSHKKTSGTFAPRGPKTSNAIQRPPSQYFNVVLIPEKSGPPRVLAGHRHFSTHAKAISNQVRKAANLQPSDYTLTNWHHTTQKRVY